MKETSREAKSCQADSTRRAANGSALRARMRGQMTEKGLSEATQAAYVRAVLGLVRQCGGRSPEAIDVAQARAYVRGLRKAGRSRTACANASAAIRFLYEVTLGRTWRPVSPLRRRMTEDMELRGFSAKTQGSYLRAVEGLARFHGRGPQTLSDEEIRRYFVHLKCERGLARPTITIALCGIKFFYESTLRRDFSVTGVPRPKREHKLPVVLSREEVRAILRQVTEMRHRACLTLIYACGLRLGEGCRVQVTDIDRARGVLHVRAAKGAKDRYVPLPAPILPLLETCWRLHRNPIWLFPSVGRGGIHGPTATSPVPLGTVQQVFRAARAVSGVCKHVAVHSLRHSYATHLLEDGVNLRQIQTWLGHNSPAVTFTVPERLRRPIRSHPRQALPLLMQSAASSLLTLCRERRFLGGLPGLTAILHTWTRQLLYHPHVHILCTGGGLDPAGAWRASAPGFLVPVRALSTIFRARFRDALRQRHPALFAAVPARVWRQPWVVHSKPVGAGGHALGYLARYVHRVALADSAILHHDDRQVVFRYREGDTGRVRTARIAPTEFIRRFLQHTLPSAFRKVRHYGLHHSSRRRTLRSLQAQLALAHRLDPPPAEPPRREPLPPRHCPLCNEPMRPCYAFDRQARPRPLPFPPARARGPPR